MKRFTAVDLFGGGGGLSEGFEQAGFEIVAGIDIWDTALETFGHNHPGAEVFHADARRIRQIPDCDVLIGGAPCYEFSVAKQCIKRTFHLHRFADYLDRKATIDECRKEMGFPDDYLFFGTKKEQYIQIGNSVCPPVAKAIAEAINKDFEGCG